MIRKTSTPSSSDRRTPALFQKLGKIAKKVSTDPSPVRVHQLRTTTRRVETLLAAGMKRGGTGKLLKQLARLRRRAGKVRDLDVQIAALREIRLEASGADKARVLRYLQKAHRKREKKLMAAAEEELAGGLQARLKNTLLELVLHPVAPPRKDFAAAALDRFARLAAAYPALNEGNLHQFRMACKRVRYLAEMSGETPAAERVATQLKRIQDAVGEWHDWLTLTEIAESLISAPHSSLLAALRTRRRSKFIHALRITAEAKDALMEMRRAGKAAEPGAGTNVVELKPKISAAAS